MLILVRDFGKLHPCPEVCQNCPYAPERFALAFLDFSFSFSLEFSCSPLLCTFISISSFFPCSIPVCFFTQLFFLAPPPLLFLLLVLMHLLHNLHNHFFGSFSQPLVLFSVVVPLIIVY